MCRLLSSTPELLGGEQGGRAHGTGGIGKSHSLCVAPAWFKDTHPIFLLYVFHWSQGH